MVIGYTAFFLVQPQDACEKKLEKVMDEQEQKEKEEVMEDKKNQEEKGKEKPSYSLEVLSKPTELVPTWAFLIRNTLKGAYLYATCDKCGFLE